MGVTILQLYPLKDRTGPQTIEFLTKRLLAMDAKPCGQFLVDCETFMSTPQTPNGVPRTFHVLHNSEQPASVFTILETGSKPIPVVADTLFDSLLVKMAPHFISKKPQAKIEVRGPKFELSDFYIKVGSVTTTQNFKGILLEIEYRACMIPNGCWDFMKEIVQGFLNTQSFNNPPQYLQSRMNEIYQPIDTIQQYLEHFILFKKAPGVLQYS